MNNVHWFLSKSIKQYIIWNPKVIWVMTLRFLCQCVYLWIILTNFWRTLLLWVEQRTPEDAWSCTLKKNWKSFRELRRDKDWEEIQTQTSLLLHWTQAQKCKSKLNSVPMVHATSSKSSEPYSLGFFNSLLDTPIQEEMQPQRKECIQVQY